MEKYSFAAEERALLEKLPQPLAIYQIIDGKYETVLLSEGFCKLFGYPDLKDAYSYMSRNMFALFHPDDLARVRQAADRFDEEKENFDVIYRTRERNGSEYKVVHATGEHVFTEEGVRLSYLWYTDEGIYTAEDIDRVGVFRRSIYNALHEESLLQASRYDPLTGLPTMTQFFLHAEEGRKEILAEGGEAVLLFLNFNGMKLYNMRNGFVEGDVLLKELGNLLSRTFGAEHCCRIGSDHFAAYTKEEGLTDVLDKLIAESQELNGGNSLPLHIGVYPASLEEVPLSSACDRARFACSLLKNNYESGYNFYDKELRDDAVQRQYILSHLDQAIKEKWIRVYYQPLIRAVNGRVCDEEALARWIDPEKGFLSPAEFIPFLEDAGTIYKLDLYMVEQVLEKIKNQREAGLYVVPQSVNLSRADFDGCDIVEEIRKRVDAAGISHDMLTIEITESTIGSDFDFMKTQVDRFRSLGFPVWMDDFGSGYSSLEVLQSFEFDLLKFDMSFMTRLDEGDNGKIILTELMRMATALGVDTACEGVETEEQVRFLREIGCSRLQGYYFTKPIPLEKIIARYESGHQIGFENPEEAEYYEMIGRINLYDLTVIASEEEDAFRKIFNMLPMAILEVKDGTVQFTRTNQSYRDFMNRVFNFHLSGSDASFTDTPTDTGAAFIRLVDQCCEGGGRAILDEQMPDGSTIHSFARMIGTNPVTGKIALAVAVLSIIDSDMGTTYAGIARALAADYYNIYYVDLETNQFIEYSSPVGGEELAMERHGDNFFEEARKDTMTRIYEEDREFFLKYFTKESILKELDKQGVFTATYRLLDGGTPLYAQMKISRMQPEGRFLIIGISIVDSLLRQKELSDQRTMDEMAHARVMALTRDYVSLYTIDPETGHYMEYISTEEMENVSEDREGDDFFLHWARDAEEYIYSEDLEKFKSEFSKEKVLEAIRDNYMYQLHCRLLINGKPRPVSLKIVSVRERSGEKLIAGIRVWRERR